MQVRFDKIAAAAFCALIVGICGAQQPDVKEKPEPKDIPEARAMLSAAEKEHPGNTVEVADALDAVIEKELDEGKVDQETLALAKRELAVAEAANGNRSKTFVSALSNMSEVYVELSLGAEARPYAERAVEISRKEFPDDEQTINAADELAYVCNALGDFACAERADKAAIALERKPGPEHDWDLAVTLSNYSSLKEKMKDLEAAGAAIEEALVVGQRARPDDPHLAVFENNAGAHYVVTLDFPKAIAHLNRAIEIFTKAYGPESPFVMSATANLADVYNRSGQFPLAWKDYEIGLRNKNATIDSQAQQHAVFAGSLASGGDIKRAVQEGLLSARMSRENFVLQARTLPERQALAYDRTRPHGLDTALSVLVRHPELPTTEIYQEVVRSRALVADEMARRQRNLNAANDPEVARLLNAMNEARAGLLAAEASAAGQASGTDSLILALEKMEKIERALAERSVAVDYDQRVNAVTTADVRRNLPAHAVLVSYVSFTRRTVEAVDPARTRKPSYAAFVVNPDSDRIAVFDLGEAAPLDELVRKARAAADAEAHSGGLGSTRNERAYREAALALRKKIWDPLASQIGDARLVLVVADGNLNLVPFAGLPQGNGYMVEHGPVIHMLSSERDLVPGSLAPKKQGLLAIGSPSFELAENRLPPSPLRGASPTCDEFTKLEFQPLPGTALEVTDIGSTWRQWNKAEPANLVTGDDATLARFLADASHSRVLHVATHAFVLDKSCGSGNPLLHSGLVFAGANQGRGASILTAQQIASLDLNGVDWAVLSACNTGNGELRDGEGVLGLQRAFRVAGAHSVIMTLWPVDDNVTRQFMHELYDQRLKLHASAADSVWNSSRKLLLERRAAGQSTHPWYWAGFVGSGGWE